MKNRVITISRQFGSAGRTIGKEVAIKLSIPCYDKEVSEKIAEKSGFTKDYIERNSTQVGLPVLSMVEIFMDILTMIIFGLPKEILFWNWLKMVHALLLEDVPITY